MRTAMTKNSIRSPLIEPHVKMLQGSSVPLERFCGTVGRIRDKRAASVVCSPSFGPTDMRHMLQGAREGTSDAGQPISRRADRPPAARAGAEWADGRELHPA